MAGMSNAAFNAEWRNKAGAMKDDIYMSNTLVAAFDGLQSLQDLVNGTNTNWDQQVRMMQVQVPSAMKFDENANNPLRNLCYGMTGMIERTIRAVVDRELSKQRQVNNNQPQAVYEKQMAGEDELSVDSGVYEADDTMDSVDVTEKSEETMEDDDEEPQIVFSNIPVDDDIIVCEPEASQSIEVVPRIVSAQQMTKARHGQTANVQNTATASTRHYTLPSSSGLNGTMHPSIVNLSSIINTRPRNSAIVQNTGNTLARTIMHRPPINRVTIGDQIGSGCAYSGGVPIAGRLLQRPKAPMRIMHQMQQGQAVEVRPPIAEIVQEDDDDIVILESINKKDNKPGSSAQPAASGPISGRVTCCSSSTVAQIRPLTAPSDTEPKESKNVMLIDDSPMKSEVRISNSPLSPSDENDNNTGEEEDREVNMTVVGHAIDHIAGSANETEELMQDDVEESDMNLAAQFERYWAKQAAVQARGELKEEEVPANVSRAASSSHPLRPYRPASAKREEEIQKRLAVDDDHEEPPVVRPRKRTILNIINRYDEDLDERDHNLKEDSPVPSFAANGWDQELMEMKNMEYEPRPNDEGIPELAEDALKIANSPVYVRDIHDRGLSPFDEITTQKRLLDLGNESNIQRTDDDNVPARKRMILNTLIGENVVGESEGRVTRSRVTVFKCPHWPCSVTQTIWENFLNHLEERHNTTPEKDNMQFACTCGFQGDIKSTRWHMFNHRGGSIRVQSFARNHSPPERRKSRNDSN